MGEPDRNGIKKNKREKRYYIVRLITIIIMWLETAAGTFIFGYITLVSFLSGLVPIPPVQGWIGLAFLIGIWTATLICYRSTLFASILWTLFSIGLICYVTLDQYVDFLYRITVGVPLIVVGFILGAMNLVVYFYQNT